MLTTRKTGRKSPHVAAPPYLSPEDPPSKRRILQSALRLFAEKGVDAVTVRDIAGHAGYTNPALFKFFTTKDALGLHLFERWYLRFFGNLKSALDDASSFEGRLTALLDVSFSCLEQDPAAFLFVQDHLRQLWPRVSGSVRRKSILVLIRHMLEQGIREGAVDSTVNPGLLVAAITGTLQQFARMYHFAEFRGAPGA